jgi:hypothetical protein
MTFPLFDQRGSGFELDLTSEIRAGAPARGEGELLIGYPSALPFAFHTHPESGNLVIELDQAPLSASAIPSLLRLIDPTWANPLVPQEGQIIVDGDIELLSHGGELRPQGALAVDSDDLAFCYGKTCIDDLDLHGKWDLSAFVNGSSHLSVGKMGLAAGMDLSNFRTLISVEESDRISLNDVSATLLDGHLRSSPIHIEAYTIGDVTLNWSGFDLGRLVTFLDVPGLDGTGRIDAQLPIINEAGGYAIRNGSFHATGPGQIRYRPGSPAANIGMQALQNFNFTSLDGTVNYRPDGRYDIRITLDGSNPDLYGGYPIRFNLNLGGELPALFRSVFITGDFGAAILDQLKSTSSKATESGG